MNRGRHIQGNVPCAYRVVRKSNGYVTYYGPYATLATAKGKRTTELNYGYPPADLEIWIEKTPDGWEKVDV